MTSRFRMDRGTHHGPTTERQDRADDRAAAAADAHTDAIAHEVQLCRSLGQGDAMAAYAALQQRPMGTAPAVYDAAEVILFGDLTPQQQSDVTDAEVSAVLAKIPCAAPDTVSLQELAA